MGSLAVRKQFNPNPVLTWASYLLLLSVSVIAQPSLHFSTILRKPKPVVSSVALAWNYSPDATVAGYKLYRGAQSQNYTWATNAGNTNFAISWWTNPPYGQTFYFAVTAYDTNGLESLPSNEISWTLPLPKTNVVVSVSGALESSPDLITWQPNFEDPWVRTNVSMWFFTGLVKPSITSSNF